MTVLSTTNRVDHVGTGITGPYAYTYRIFSATDLLVTTRDLNGLETTLANTTDYTVSGVGSRTGGTITLVTALVTGWALTIRRVRPLTQATDIRNQGEYFPETHEDAFDSAMMVDQQLDERIQASVALPESISPATFNPTLPAVLTPGTAVVVNALGTGFSMGNLSAAQLSAWSAANTQVLDSFTSAHGDFTPNVTTTLTLSKTPAAVQNIWVTMRISGLDRVFMTDEFSVSGTTLTFTAAIPTGTTRVEVRYFYTYQINTTDAVNVTYSPASGSATDVRTRLRSIDATLANDIYDLYLKDFGVVGDGSTDDTVNFQAALTAGASQNKVVNGGNLVVRITAAVTMAGPGLVFSHAPHGNAGGPGIKITGSGYTALTVSGIVSRFNVTLYGTGNTANGVLFANPILSWIENTRVFNLDGFGVRVNNCYDCLFGTTSVEQCGNASNYAFSVNDNGQTSNMSHWLRIQVEKANTKAIFISANTLSCVFDNIHSEQATPSAGVDTWFLGGSRCLYNAARFASLAPSANATLHLNGGNTDYYDFLTEGSIAVNVEGSTILSINGAEIQGTLTAVPNQTARIILWGGNITAIAGQPQYTRAFGVKIGTLTVDFSNNPADPTLGKYYNCDITTLASASAVSAATFDGCTIGEGNSLLRGATVFNNCDITCAGTVAHSSGILTLNNSTLHAALTYTNHASIRLRNGSRITGTVSCGDAGNVDMLCDESSTIGSGSTGVGIPTNGAHNVGDFHKNPIPVVASPKGWLCTVAGTPGTFVSTGNL